MGVAGGEEEEEEEEEEEDDEEEGAVRAVGLKKTREIHYILNFICGYSASKLREGRM
jgi:hypothetical protein